MAWTLAATAAASALGAAVYVALAVALHRRRVAGEARIAMRAFALYWACTGLYQALVAGQHALAAAGVAPFGLALAVRYVGLVVAAVGLGGLLGYFGYLLTGRRSAVRLAAIAYALAAVLGVVHVWRSAPSGVATTAWFVDVSYAGDFHSGLFLPLLLVMQVVPLVGAAWYASIARRMSDPAQRRRVLAVGGGVTLQLLGFLVARVVESEPAQLVARTVLAFAVALLIHAAYAPWRVVARADAARTGS